MTWFNKDIKVSRLVENINKFYHPRDTQYLTHNFHIYPNKFIPQIVKELINEYTEENNLILDPFCGSGTVLIEANLLKRNVIGIDLNPLAYLISKVKTTKLNILELRQTKTQLLEQFKEKVKNKDTLYDFIPQINPYISDFPKKEKWYKKHILRELIILKKLISQLQNKKMKDFYLVAFSSIVKEVSNASSLYRLTLAKQEIYFSEFYVFSKFETIVNNMINKMEICNPKIRTNFIQIQNGDSRLPLPNQKVDFILTNPPRFNFDFPRSFKIYFWWLYENIKIADLDRKLIGTKTVNTEIYNFDIIFIDELIAKIKEKRKGIAKALSKYFRDMQIVFNNLYEILKEGKYCCVKTSDFVLYGNQIEISKIFTELAKREGFKLEKILERTVPKRAFIFAKKDRLEEYLIFRK